MKIQTTNSQEIYNHLQFFNESQILVIDLRTEEHFSNYHIRDSINVPLNTFSLDELSCFDESAFINKYWHSKHHKSIFKGRKRALIILVAFEDASSHLLNQMPNVLGCGENVENQSSSPNWDELSLINAIFFNKLLQNQRHRFTYLCKSGMKQLSARYPSICEFKNQESTK